MAVYWTDFSEYPTGQEPSGYSEQFGEPSALNIAEVAGAIGGKVLNFSTSASSSSVHARIIEDVSSDPDNDNIEFLAKFRYNNDQGSLIFGARQINPFATRSVYWHGNYVRGSDHIELAKHVNGSYSTMALDFDGIDFVVGTWYWVRVRINGDNHFYKEWVDGDPEPETWTLTDVDSDVSGTGNVLLNGWGNDEDWDLDILSIATGSEVAPTEKPVPTEYDEFTIPNPASDLDNVVLGFNLADNMSADWWSEVDTTDGTKLRIHKEDGTELPFDIVGFDDVAETGFLWVRWDGTITSAGTQKIRISPPKVSNVSYGADFTHGRLATWVDYEHVWTLNEDPSGTAPQFLDRAGTDDMETFGTPSSVAGLLGNAVEFAFSSGEYLQTENLTGPTATDSLTFSIWTNIATKEDFMMAIGEHGGNMGMTYRSDQDKFFAWIDASNYVGLVTHQTTPQIGEWNKITFKLTPTEFNILMNGVAGNAPESNVGTLNSNAKDEWVISRRSGSADRNWDGQLQYAMVRNLAISDDQDAYEYSNQEDMATFWGVGTWVDGNRGIGSISGNGELNGLGSVLAQSIGTISGGGDLNGNGKTIRQATGSISGNGELNGVGDAPVEPQTYSTDFSEYTSDQAPTNWTKRWQDMDFIVRDVASVLGGKVLRAEPNVNSVDNTIHAISWDAVDADTLRNDVDILVRFRHALESGQQSAWAIGRGQGTLFADKEGYASAHYENLEYDVVGKWVNGASWDEIVVETGVTQETDVWYYKRFRIEGNQLKSKIWQVGTVEPVTWEIETTDNDITDAGWVGIGVDEDPAGLEVDYFSVATGGAIAPEPIPVLLNPLDTAINIPVQTDLEWIYDLGFDSFDIEISTDNTFVSVDYSIEAFDKQIFLSDYDIILDTNETYYWRVRAVNGGVDGDWSTADSFTTRNDQFSGGDGTVNDPYQIGSPQALSDIRNNLTAYYRLIADINLAFDTQNASGDFYNNGEGWLPIEGFAGEFDLNGHSIIRLYINRGSQVGLFIHSDGAYIHDGEINIIITSGTDIGGVDGWSENNTIIERVKISGTMGSIESPTGARVGSVVGRFAGDGNPQINDSYSLVPVVMGNINSGGFFGRSFKSSGTTQINRTYISAETRHFDGDGSAQSGTQGAHAGWTSDLNVSASFYNSDLDLLDQNNGGATAQTTAQMMNINTYINAGWDIVLIENHDGNKETANWYIDDGVDYPRLWFEYGTIEDAQGMGSVSGNGELNGLGSSPISLESEGIGTISGNGELNGSGKSVRQATGSISGNGELNGSGKSIRQATGTISGNGELNGLGEEPIVLPPEGIGAISGNGELNGIGKWRIDLQQPTDEQVDVLQPVTFLWTYAEATQDTIYRVKISTSEINFDDNIVEEVYTDQTTIDVLLDYDVPLYWSVEAGTASTTFDETFDPTFGNYIRIDHSDIWSFTPVLLTLGIGSISGNGELNGLGLIITQATGSISGNGELNGLGEEPIVQPNVGVGTISGGGNLTGIAISTLDDENLVHNWDANENNIVIRTIGDGIISGGGELNGLGEAPIVEPTVGFGTISGNGELNGSGKSIRQATGSISGNGELVGDGHTPIIGQKRGRGGISGQGTLNGLGKAIRQATGSISGGGELNGLGEEPIVVPTVGVGSISGGGELNGLGKTIRKGVATISGNGELNGIGKSLSQSTGSISGGGELNGLGKTIRQATGSISGGGELNGSGKSVRQAIGSISGGGELNGSGLIITKATGSISGGGTLNANGKTIRQATGSISGGGELNGRGKMSILGAGEIHGGGELNGLGLAHTMGVGTLSGNGELNGSGRIVTRATGSISGNGELNGNGSVVRRAIGSISGGGELNANGLIITKAVGSISGNGELDGHGYIFTRGISEINGGGTILGVTKRSGNRKFIKVDGQKTIVRTSF